MGALIPWEGERDKDPDTSYDPPSPFTPDEWRIAQALPAHTHHIGERADGPVPEDLFGTHGKDYLAPPPEEPFRRNIPSATPASPTAMMQDGVTLT